VINLATSFTSAITGRYCNSKFQDGVMCLQKKELTPYVWLRTVAFKTAMQNGKLLDTNYRDRHFLLSYRFPCT